MSADTFHNNTQWYFQLNDMKKTPSITSKLCSFEQEIDFRARGISFLTHIANALRLPQVTIATACTYFHRFFMRQTFREFHQYDIAVTCLFISCKEEDTGRHIQHFLHEVIKRAFKTSNPSEQTLKTESRRWLDVLAYNEPIVLYTICFDLAIDLPYRHVLNFMENWDGYQAYKKARLNGEFYNDTSTMRNAMKLALTAWTFVNDSYKTTVCLTHQPKVIAAAATFIASKHSNIPLNSDATKGLPWWSAFDVSIDEVQEASNIILSQYDNNPAFSSTQRS